MTASSHLPDTREHNPDQQSPEAPARTLTINYNGMRFIGNDQQILLEQLEQQNIAIPYSCRSGICESCKITLLQGEVVALNKAARCKDGGILSCSCVPKGDIVLGPSKEK